MDIRRLTKCIWFRGMGVVVMVTKDKAKGEESERSKLKGWNLSLQDTGGDSAQTKLLNRKTISDADGLYREASKGYYSYCFLLITSWYCRVQWKFKC